MRNKQINLYRNVFEVEQQRRRTMLLASLLAIFIVCPTIFLSYYIKGMQSASLREIESIEQQAKAEKLLVDEVSGKLQKAELAKRKDSTDERVAQLKAQSIILNSKVGGEIISLLLSIEPSSSKFTAFSFKENALTFTGEALNKLAAIKIMEDLSNSLSTTDWVVKKWSISGAGDKVIFELIVAGQLEGDQKR